MQKIDEDMDYNCSEYRINCNQALMLESPRLCKSPTPEQSPGVELSPEEPPRTARVRWGEDNQVSIIEQNRPANVHLSDERPVRYPMAPPPSIERQGTSLSTRANLRYAIHKSNRIRKAELEKVVANCATARQDSEEEDEKENRLNGQDKENGRKDAPAKVNTPRTPLAPRSLHFSNSGSPLRAAAVISA